MVFYKRDVFGLLTSKSLASAYQGVCNNLMRGYSTAVRYGQGLDHVMRNAKSIDAILEPALAQLAPLTTKALTSGVRQRAETYDDLKRSVTDANETMTQTGKRLKQLGM